MEDATITETTTATVATVSALRAQLMLLLADLRLREDRNDESFAAALNEHALTRALAPAGGWQPVNARHLALALGLYRRPGRRTASTM